MMEKHQISEAKLEQMRKLGEAFISVGLVNKQELDSFLKSARTNQELASKPPFLISRAKGAQILGISTRSLDRIVKDGYLSRIKVGKRSVRLDEREIERYIQVNGSIAS